MAAVMDPLLSLPWLDWLGDSSAEHSHSPIPPQREGAGLVGCREGLDPRLGDGTDLPSLSEMEEPQWPISDPTLSYPAPSFIGRHKETAGGGESGVSFHPGVLVSGWHSMMALCPHPLSVTWHPEGQGSSHLLNTLYICK